ncbi:MAG TPA: PhzF family phenazine biosynthesis protein, partial [Acidimicrobiales bacterium]|nr:PhzF family phenazine biosynthesis protein [Acidimicrobiales bacterium]
MPDALRLLRYDVFTDRPYAGNPLAVVLDAPPLPTSAMQAVAQELNLSETVFLTARGDGSWDTRIFTPATELPFAGHPTVGAAVALADEGLVDGDVVLHEGIGPVRVELQAGRATLTTPAAPAPVAVADPGDVVACLGLELADLHPELGPRGWSAGVPFTIVALRDVDGLGRAEVDLARWREAVARSGAPDLYLLAPLDGVRGERWRARMFGPGLGVVEDPATGSAAAAACAYLAGAAAEARLEEGWTIEQGVEMGRPSEIRVTPVRRAGELVAVRVGGRAVRVGEGRLTIP